MKKEFLRFIFVGVINTIFGYTVFSFFVFLKIHYSIALILSTIMGIFFNFHTVGKYVFLNNISKNLYKFILVYIVSYFLNLFLIKFLFSIGFNYYSAAAIISAPVAIILFLTNKYYVFK